MATKFSSLLILTLASTLIGVVGAQQKPDDIPDAPSATRPIPPPPAPSQRQEAEDENTANPPAPDNSGAGITTGSKELPHSAPEITYDKSVTPPPMPPVTTVPAGSVPKDLETGQDLFTISRTVNLVMVPVTIKDSEGRLVSGLQPKDFAVLEGGQPQTLKFFTSDPFALSAAIVIDTGMADVALKKVQDSLSALQGAFSQFDEVGIYTYSSTVGRVSDFGGVGKQLTAVLNEIRSYTGTNNGVPVTSGPLGPQGPMINGLPVGGAPVTPASNPPRVARVMNDAILLAARDLSKRPRDRRKIIFIISDGREQGSTASYKDTLKVLLTQNITVYGVGLEGAAIPIYDKLQHIHVPKTAGVMGYSDILPKYVNATGGGTVFNELSQATMERAYASAIGEARNQYTLGYSPKSTIGGYRDIDVQVRRLGVKVYAKAGYYPLPTPR